MRVAAGGRWRERVVLGVGPRSHEQRLLLTRTALPRLSHGLLLHLRLHGLLEGLLRRTGVHPGDLERSPREKLGIRPLPLPSAFVGELVHG